MAFGGLFAPFMIMLVGSKGLYLLDAGIMLAGVLYFIIVVKGHGPDKPE